MSPLPEFCGFGAFAPAVSVEQEEEQVSGQRDTVTSDHNEQAIYILKQEIEHLNTLLASKDLRYRQPETGDVAVAGEPKRSARTAPSGASAVLKCLSAFLPCCSVSGLSFSSFCLLPAVARYFSVFPLLLLPDGQHRRPLPGHIFPPSPGRLPCQLLFLQDGFALIQCLPVLSSSCYFSGILHRLKQAGFLCKRFPQYTSSAPL